MVNSSALPSLRLSGSANDRLKESFRTWFWASVAGAALLHFLVLALTPRLSVADWQRPSTVMDVLPPVHEYQIPPPPEEIARPQVPVVGSVDVSADVTLPEMGELFRERPELPPPPIQAASAGDATPPFTPYSVAPELRAAQRTELQRYLERNYPPALRDAGIGARAVLWVHIDEQGNVRETRVVQSSGYPAFDAVASEALQHVRFSPALNRDERVPVWIQLPIQFQVR
jgi:periplasmic protein TonB